MADAAPPPAASNVAQLLETLHPLREPSPPPSALPYLAMLGLGIAVAACAVALLRLRRRRSLRAAATAALARSRPLAPADRLAAQAELLRRLVRATRGEAEARAQGPAWLAALDGTFATSFFTRGEGSVFGDGLYRRVPAADLDKLDRALAGLIGRARLDAKRLDAPWLGSARPGKARPDGTPSGAGAR